MKKHQFFLSMMTGVALVATGYLGLQTFSHSENEYSSLLLQNIEALSDDSEQSNYMYPNREGTPEKCTLYVYIDLETGLTIPTGSDSDPSFSSNFRYVKVKKTGAEDFCKDKGNGCNLYTCREVSGPTNN